MYLGSGSCRMCVDMLHILRHSGMYSDTSQAYKLEISIFV